MLHLHDALDDICIKVASRQMEANSEDASKLILTEIQWKVPFRIVSFCQNRIEELEKNPQLVKDYEIMAWSRFKELIFDIYDHRIMHAPEINNSMNATYCTLNEHLLIYFVEVHRQRAKAEQKIVELLINLRYYFQHWERARMFAQNLELIYVPKDKSFLRAEDDRKDKFGDWKVFRQPHAILQDADIAVQDVFSQEFFLHAYSLLSQDRRRFLESSEGQTYVSLRFHDRVANKIITLIRGSGGDIQKWNLKVRRLSKRIKNKGGQEGDYLDLDLIISMLMEEYKASRAMIAKDLERQFSRLYPRGKNAGLEIDGFLEMVGGS